MARFNAKKFESQRKAVFGVGRKSESLVTRVSKPARSRKPFNKVTGAMKVGSKKPFDRERGVRKANYQRPAFRSPANKRFQREQEGKE